MRKGTWCCYLDLPTPRSTRSTRIRRLDCHGHTPNASSITASYPPVPHRCVHRTLTWIHAVLSNIAFQYYPLDLGTASNPFVVSWWPLALADPALFHVSLQTASLDEELRAQKGFSTSELLMMDSVSLVRRKIESPELACRDETLNAVVTLAAIEVSSPLHRGQLLKS